MIKKCPLHLSSSFKNWNFCGSCLFLIFICQYGWQCQLHMIKWPSVTSDWPSVYWSLYSYSPWSEWMTTHSLCGWPSVSLYILVHDVTAKLSCQWTQKLFLCWDALCTNIINNQWSLWKKSVQASDWGGFKEDKAGPRGFPTQHFVKIPYVWRNCRGGGISGMSYILVTS